MLQVQSPVTVSQASFSPLKWSFLAYLWIGPNSFYLLVTGLKPFGNLLTWQSSSFHQPKSQDCHQITSEAYKRDAPILL